MGLLDRYRRLPYLEAEKQRFLALELISLVIIMAGCISLLLALVFENMTGGISQSEAFRILRISVGFFMVIIGLALLLYFMYQHVSALEDKLDELKAPKEPKGMGVTQYAAERQREMDEEAAKKALTPEEIKARKVAEALALAERIKTLEESFEATQEGGATYKKCPMCGALYTEDWDICPKCGAKVK
jgi:hypothetical protein